jgi:hypothetical protein
MSVELIRSPTLRLLTAVRRRLGRLLRRHNSRTRLVGPYADWHSTPAPKVKHLRLNLAGHASTSIALVIRKAG